jgi:hypothetical protein
MVGPSPIFNLTFGNTQIPKYTILQTDLFCSIAELRAVIDFLFIPYHNFYKILVFEL